ncbi:tripartite motif-containing protein 35-like [Colossoma macropomum]|uniref:tripartite motif-containing protein 35-like n=1 Tax=Colossoma macropomum TaxID=42526 RepID=UPI001864547F|nr:tripartite motif-containing protein 35-like [Colossoma macropomum]
MAAKSSLSEKDLSCILCCDIYVDPVLLSCRHSFCKDCWEEYQQTKKPLKCPLCRKQCPKGFPPLNLQLKVLCDNFRQERDNSAVRSETLCGLHKEELKLFCLEDKEPVCVVCRESKLHSRHSFRPLDEAAFEHREELRAKLKPLQEKLHLFLKAKLICDQTAQHITSQAENTERRIKEEFEKLHQFLRDEEENSLSALRTEVRVKSQITKKTASSINHEILNLSETITSTHEELASDDISFLKNYKATVESTECKLKDPEILSGALIDMAKHLGNLKFRVWEKMKDIVKYTPVILDSNTAHQRLTISDDLTSFVCTDEPQQLPENPERFDHYLWVQGSEGFHSGTHCWDVDVENCEQWALGVVTGSMKKGKTSFSGGIWKCHYENILYGSSSSGGPTTVLRVRESLRKIRVQLDFDEGQVSFWNPISGRHLQTFLYTFIEPVFPYFCNRCKRHPLRILPKETSVVIQWPKYRTEELAYLTTDSSA